MLLSISIIIKVFKYMDVNHSNHRPTHCFVVHKYNLNGKQQPNQHFSLYFFQLFFIFILIHKFFCACTECSRSQNEQKMWTLCECVFVYYLQLLDPFLAPVLRSKRDPFTHRTFGQTNIWTIPSKCNPQSKI